MSKFLQLYRNGNVMQKILVIGDFHIPRRARDIPKKMKDFLNEQQKFNLVLCTGDLIVSSMLQKIEKFGPVKVVMGNMDYQSLDPDRHLIEVEGWNLGVIHGDVVHPRGDVNKLVTVADNLDVDVLISGHTHMDMIQFKDKKLLLNPGSAVGAWSFVSSNIASFMILEITRETLNVLLYKLIYQELNLEKQVFQRKSFS